jgi:thymidylate synthase
MIEQDYLDLVKKIIEQGHLRTDRTNVGTTSLFGTQLRCNLQDGFPLLTTKKMAWKAIVAELLWFISGKTDAKILQQQGVSIWNGNSSREYLDKLGFNHRQEGDLGPVYGFQWRHFGAKYIDCKADYNNQGVDQLAELIHKIKTNPHDRRLLICSWNPVDIPIMALPPCHLLCQFYVQDKILSCQMYQRSADMGLGVPFNMASYALLTHLIAHVCDLQVGQLIMTFGDTHVYTNHIEALQTQLDRQPGQLPTIKINTDVKDIDNITIDDILLQNYVHQGVVKMDMAV